MDEKQLHYEFMSIPGESHPGLTFEEYRDTCVFLLFYHYLCLRFDDRLDDAYKLDAMVRMAVRGKLQLPSFLRFIEDASPFIHLAGGDFQLTDFSFYRNLTRMQSTEKQKSYARFVRKMIKKMNLWGSGELLLEKYPVFFEELLQAFAGMKKETAISSEVLRLYRLFFSKGDEKIRRVFVPEFTYGTLYRCMAENPAKLDISGCDSHEGYREILKILGYMKGVPEGSLHVYDRKEWEEESEDTEKFDAIGIYMPEGAEAGSVMAKNRKSRKLMEKIGPISKGELPFLLSAFSMLKEDGVLAAILPGALLYREGKESQLRRFLVSEKNGLDLVMLLPDHILQTAGQKEVLLLLRKNRPGRDVMFFDCSEVESFGSEQLNAIGIAWKERKTVPGFCSRVEQTELEQNDFNLNLPRYIVKTVKVAKVDIDARKKRIAEIDRELEEIEERIAMYKRDLEL